MVEYSDIHNLLQNGYWPSSRAKSPRPNFSGSPTMTSYSSYRGRQSPRVVPDYNFRRSDRPERRRRLPRPTVEDEVDAVTKEYEGVVSEYPDEEPTHRGEIDQGPLLILVHEHNPERRYVLVSNPSESSDESSSVAAGSSSTDSDSQASYKRRTERGRGGEARGHRLPQRKSSYEANTCRKYVILTPSEDEKKETEKEMETEKEKTEPLSRRRETTTGGGHERRPTRERRRSRREDLPTIVTDLPPLSNSRSTEGPPRDNTRRTKSAVNVEADKNVPDDDFSPRRRLSQRVSMTPNESASFMLSPDVIKHSTKGRDRAYWDYNGASSAASAAAQNRSRPTPTEETQYGISRNPSIRRRDGGEGARSGSSNSPVMPKRHSAVDVPKETRRTSKEDYDTGGQQTLGSVTPPRLERVLSDPRYSRPERAPLPPRSASFWAKPDASSHVRDRYSSDENVPVPVPVPVLVPVPRRNVSRCQRKSMRYDDDDGYLTTPLEARHTGARKSRPPSPTSPRLISPTMSSNESREVRSERAPSLSPRSSTFSRDSGRAHPGYPPDDDPFERSLASINSPTSSVAIAARRAAAIAAATASSDLVTPIDHRRSPIATPQPRQSYIDIWPGSNPLTPSSTPPNQIWQPPSFDVVRTDDFQSDGPFTASYRRYSEDVDKGELPEIPDCPRTKEEAGHHDWLTLPRCNTFNICPSCYQSAFEGTKYRNQIVPAPFRPVDRPLRCDFGASQWYHIAWLLTHKYRQPDLRMFHNITSIREPPCTGVQPAYRMWYTIKNPTTQQPVRNFHSCANCVQTIEVLLPNLSGVFVPLDTPVQPTRRVCDMHQQNMSGRVRKRFIEYFDIMETISDQALATGRAPDTRALADRVSRCAETESGECTRDQPVRGAKWYMMRSVPDATVCPECFYDVVWPELQRGNSGVQGNFLLYPQELRDSWATCQLYSPRMRDAFRRAVRRGDSGLRYFDAKVRERREKEAELCERLNGLDRVVLGDEWVDGEVERLAQEWSAWE